MHEQPPETHPTGRTGQGPAKRCAALCAIGIVFPLSPISGVSHPFTRRMRQKTGQGPIDGPMQGFRAGPVPGTHQTTEDWLKLM